MHWSFFVTLKRTPKTINYKQLKINDVEVKEIWKVIN